MKIGYAQELINEIDLEQKEIAMIKSISANTLRQWSKYGIEPYIETKQEDTNNGINK